MQGGNTCGTNSLAQRLQVCHCEEAKGRRGALSAKREEVPLGCNLAVPDPSWESYRRNRNCLPEIATGAKRPRNGKLEGFSPQNMCRKHCHPPWRSLTAATDAIGVYRFIGSLYQSPALCRERHAAPLQWCVRSIPPIIRGGPEWSHSGPLCFTFGYTVQWRGAGGSGSVPAPRHSAHRRCGSRSCPRRAWHRSRCLGRT